LLGNPRIQHRQQAGAFALQSALLCQPRLTACLARHPQTRLQSTTP
jgi:hypothetical protein